MSMLGEVAEESTADSWHSDLHTGTYGAPGDTGLKRERLSCVDLLTWQKQIE